MSVSTLQLVRSGRQKFQTVDAKFDVLCYAPVFESHRIGLRISTKNPFGADVGTGDRPLCEPHIWDRREQLRVERMSGVGV